LISDIVGCDITLKDIRVAKQDMINLKYDLEKDVNKSQKLRYIETTPLHHFCGIGRLLMIKLLFLIGADCTQLCKDRLQFPMLVAAQLGYLDICKWLFKYGGNAKYQINKETSDGGYPPLGAAYEAWLYGKNNEGKTCRWLLRNGGGQQYSSNAMRRFIEITGKEEMKSNLLLMWIRENILLHDTTFILFSLWCCNYECIIVVIVGTQ